MGHAGCSLAWYWLRRDHCKTMALHALLKTNVAPMDILLNKLIIHSDLSVTKFVSAILMNWANSSSFCSPNLSLVEKIQKLCQFSFFFSKIFRRNENSQTIKRKQARASITKLFRATKLIP
jgi:hypothetical protein